MDYEDDFHNYDSNYGICEEDDDDDNNNYDKYNGIQDANYYDNAGDYNYDNTDNNNKNKMMTKNVVYHGRDGANPNQSKQQKEKEITSKSKESGDRNDLAKVK